MLSPTPAGISQALVRLALTSHLQWHPLLPMVLALFNPQGLYCLHFLCHVKELVLASFSQRQEKVSIFIIALIQASQLPRLRFGATD